MKTSEILKLAKPLIERYQFICVAIRNIDVSGLKVTYKEVGDVMRMVQGRITRDTSFTTLESWLNEVHGINIRTTKLSQEKFQEKVQKTRHAWIDSMIAEFEAIGD